MPAGPATPLPAAEITRPESTVRVTLGASETTIPLPANNSALTVVLAVIA